MEVKQASEGAAVIIQEGDLVTINQGMLQRKFRMEQDGLRPVAEPAPRPTEPDLSEIP